MDGTTVNSRLVYDPWGKVTETGAVRTDFAFTGHHFDRPSGLALTWWRGYDPSLGRWLSKDPIGLAGGVNLYGYVDNDPINYTDPSGLVRPSGPQGCCIAAAIAFYWSCLFSTGDHEGCVQKTAELIELCYRKIPPKDPFPQCKN